MTVRKSRTQFGSQKVQISSYDSFGLSSSALTSRTPRDIAFKIQGQSLPKQARLLRLLDKSEIPALQLEFSAYGSFFSQIDTTQQRNRTAFLYDPKLIP